VAPISANSSNAYAATSPALRSPTNGSYGENRMSGTGRKQTLVLLQPHRQSFQIFSHGSVTSHPITTFQPPPVELVDIQGRSRSKSSTLNLDWEVWTSVCKVWLGRSPRCTTNQNGIVGPGQSICSRQNAFKQAGFFYPGLHEQRFPAAMTSEFGLVTRQTRFKHVSTRCSSRDRWDRVWSMGAFIAHRVRTCPVSLFPMGPGGVQPGGS